MAEQIERILRAGAVLCERLRNRADVAHRHSIDEQLLHHLHHDTERQSTGRQVFDELRRGFREAIEQVLHFLVTEQLIGMTLQELAQVRGDDRRRIDDREAERLRVLFPGRLDPVRVEAERGVLRAHADDMRGHTAGIDREIAVDLNLPFADRHAEDRDAIAVRLQLEVVADVHRLNEEPELLRQLAAHGLDAREQGPGLVAVDERDQAIADLETDEVDRADVFPAELAVGGRRFDLRRARRRLAQRPARLGRVSRASSPR